ncbi:hypothetical protein BH18ACI5_BH18ACI5_03580 [soil metagenome]
MKLLIATLAAALSLAGYQTAPSQVTVTLVRWPFT